MNADREKMLWRCRRGIRELDSLLMPFVEDCYDELPTPDKALLRALLGCQDTQLLDWMLGRGMPGEEDLQSLITLIVRYSRGTRKTKSI